MKAIETTAGEYHEIIAARQVDQHHPNAAGLVDAAITTKGYEILPSGFKSYRFFTDGSDEYNVLGLHLPLQRIVGYFGTYRFPNKNQPVLMLVSPTGAGKSSVVNRLTRGLERFVADQPNLYTIVGCPINESPLNLFFGRKEVPTELCPHCQNSLENEHKGRWQDMPIKKLRFSAARGIGIGRLEPRQTRAGVENQQTVDQIILGANKGILEIPEFCQHDPEFLRSMLDLFRGGVLQVGRERFKLDLVVLAHTTRREFEEFSKDIKNNGPLLERLRTIYIPYIKSLNDEKSIYAADLNILANSLNLHLAPGALEVGAEIAIRTRFRVFDFLLNGNSMRLAPADKVLLYNDQNTSTITQNNRRTVEMESDKAGEGLDGISPPKMSRELAKLMTTTEGCFNPLDFLAALIDWIDDTPVSEMPNKSAWKDEAKAVQTKFKADLLAAVERAFEEKYEILIKNLFDQYTESANRSMNPNRPIDIDKVTGQDRLAPDEKLLAELEGLMGMSPIGGRDFRKAFLTNPVWMKKQDGTSADDFPQLNEAIRKKVTGTGEKPREILKLVTPTPQQQVLIDEARNRLEQKGFCPICSDKAIKFAAAEFRKR